MTIAPKATTFEAQHLVIRADTKANGQVKPGTTIRLSGTYLPTAIRMSIELTDPMNTSPRKEPGAPEGKVEVRLTDSYDIPDGSSLVLSLDRLQRFFEEPKVTSERLIVITPRRIVLEADEVVIGRDSAVKPAAHPEKP
jgi:hypothetical protein